MKSAPWCPKIFLLATKNHLLNFFKRSNIAPLKNTMEHSGNIISLPLHPDLTFEDLEYVADNLILLLELT